MSRSTPLGWGGWLGLILAALGCGGGEAPETPGARSPWAVVEQAFGAHFFDAASRRAELTSEAAESLILPGLIEQGAYRYLHVADLQRVDDRSRTGAVAFALSGWPAILELALRRDEAGWRISGVGRPEVQRVLVALFGEDGLPRAASGLAWSGGLAGRDAVGRPTATVLLLVVGDRAWVDGRAVEAARADAIAPALREAMAARQQLAKAAHATYRARVAVALGRRAEHQTLVMLLRLAIRAGAEALFLAVRGEGGAPALLPLAHRVPAPLGERPPVLAQIRLGSEAIEVHLQGRDAVERVPLSEGGAIDRGALAQGLSRARRAASSLAGGTIEAPDFGHLVALLDALRLADPALAWAVALETPEATPEGQETQK